LNKALKERRKRLTQNIPGADNVTLRQAGQKVLGYTEEKERKTLFRIIRGK
jgi:hypothetical protein